MIDEITQADPARAAAPTAAEGARMDDELRRLMAAETPVGAAAGDAWVGAADDARVGAAGDARVGAAGDPPATSRAHRRLGRRGNARVAPPRRAPRARRAGVLAPVGLVAAALMLGVAVPGGKTPAVLQPPPANAATFLTDLERKAASAATPQGRYAYLKQLAYVSHMSANDEVRVLPHEYEQWVADDGSGVTKQEIKSGDARDRLPPFDGSPQAVAKIEVLGMSVAEVRALPTDPVALKAKLEDRDNVIVTAYAGALLSFAGTPQDVKAALFAVLKRLPGAELVASATDPLKRTGVGVQFEDEAWRTLFLFNPDTGALLGTKSIGKKEVPGRTIEDWNLTVESSRTDSAPTTAR